MVGGTGGSYPDNLQSTWQTLHTNMACLCHVLHNTSMRVHAVQRLYWHKASEDLVVGRWPPTIPCWCAWRACPCMMLLYIGGVMICEAFVMQAEWQDKGSYQQATGADGQADSAA